MIPLTQKVNEGGVLVDRPLYYLRNIADKTPVITQTLSNTIHPNPPNPGPGQEYLPILIDDPKPAFDSLYSTRTEGRTVNEDLHQVEIHYTITDRPLADRLVAVANARRNETNKQFPSQDSSDALVLTVAALLRLAKGLELTPVEQTYADKLVTVAAVLQKNADHEADLKAAVIAGQKPDLVAPWEPVAAIPVTP